MPPFEQRKSYEDYAYNFDRQRQATPAWSSAPLVTTQLLAVVGKTDSRKIRLLGLMANNMSYQAMDVGVYNGASLLFSVQVPASSTVLLQSEDKFGLADLSAATTLQLKANLSAGTVAAPLGVRVKTVTLQL